MKETLHYGMVGGALDSFIGVVHRNAISFENKAFLTAGCFSRRAEANRATGEAFGLAPERVYDCWADMAAAEAAREDGIDFVVVTTPNASHYEVCKGFLEAGIHVVCEKPLCFTVEQAEELAGLAREKQLLFCVMYSYSGFNMVKQARELILDGAIGEVIDVNAEYLQEWLVDDIGSSEDVMAKLSVWRKDPAVAGASNCVGDIGSHIEHTVAYMTGLSVKRVAAKLDYFGQPLDLNANMLVELENGAHGVFCSSQVCCGHMNGLVVRVFGTEGAIEWRQEDPNYLFVTRKGQPMQVYNRGMGYITGRAAEINRIPSGHPEGLHIAFANVYKTYINALLRKINGLAAEPFDDDFPTVEDGLRGVKFIHACIESSGKDAAWVALD